MDSKEQRDSSDEDDDSIQDNSEDDGDSSGQEENGEYIGDNDNAKFTQFFPAMGRGIQSSIEILLTMAKKKLHGFKGGMPELPLGKKIRIAILDTGVDLSHEVFNHQKTLENGLVEDFTHRRKKSKKRHNKISDQMGHGTFCAGIAVGDFSKLSISEAKHYDPPWLMGIAPFAELLVGRIDDMKSTSNGITWAMEKQADIISMSFGFTHFSSKIADAIYMALKKEIIIVCAVSNEGSLDGSTVVYPAKLGNVICVGSHGSSGEPSKFSGVGREMDFLAPGKDICSASIENKKPVCEDSGTSFATPYVAGVCALVIAFADLSGVPGLRQKVSNPVVMKSLLRSMASQPGVHDQIIGHGLLDPSRLFKFSVQHFEQKVANILQDKQEAVTRNGNAVPGTDHHDNQLHLDFRRPMELLLSMTKFPQMRDKANQLKDEMYVIVNRYLAGQFMPPLLSRRYDSPCSATVADLRLSNIDKHIGLDIPDGMIIRLNILDLLESYKALQLVMLTEVPKKHRLFLDLKLTKPYFVYIDIVRLSQLQILISFQNCFTNPQNLLFVVNRLDIDTAPNEKLDPFDQLCVHVQNITGNITGYNNAGETSVSQAHNAGETSVSQADNAGETSVSQADNAVETSVSLATKLKIINSQFAGAKRDKFTTLDDMPHKQTFERLMSLPESEVLSAENEISKIGTMFDEYMKLCEEELQTSLDESVRAVLKHVNQMSQICKINLQLPATYLSSSVAFSDQMYDILYLSGRKRQKRLKLGKSLGQISSKARLEIAYLPAAVVKDVDSVLSCPILKNCNVLDLGEDLDIFELITWATVTSTHITTPIVLRCRQVNITNSRNLLELPPENVKVKFENLRLEVKEVLFNCDCPPWTNLTPGILDKVMEYIKLFAALECTWTCIKKNVNAECSTRKKLQDKIVGLEPRLRHSYTDINYDKYSIVRNPSCTCDSSIVPYRKPTEIDLPRAQSLMSSQAKGSDVMISRNLPDTVQTSPVSIAVVHTGTQLVNREAVNWHGSTCNLSSEKLLDQYVLSGGQDNETFYGRRIECRSNHAEDEHIKNDNRMNETNNYEFSYEKLPVLTNQPMPPETRIAHLVYNLSISEAVKRKLVHLCVPSVFAVDSNHLADSLTVMLKQEEAGGLPEVNIVVIPFGFTFHNQRLFEALCEVSGKRKIIITAALKMTSSTNSLSEITYPGLYGDVLLIGNCDEKGNASQLTPRGRELDFLVHSSCLEESCILVANLVARILEHAHSIGGEPLMRAICHNAVMRELLRRHCSARVGHHDFVHGYGELNREDIFMFIPDDFKRAVADITSDYQFEET